LSLSLERPQCRISHERRRDIDRGAHREEEMRSIVLTGAVVASLACSTGTALAQKAGGVLKMYHRDNPPSLSIHEEATNSTVIPIMSVMNNLVLFDQSKPQNGPDDIVPDLAKSWSWSADGKDLIFKLQEGVKWHDGKPFTAKDVVCTFDMLMNKGDNKLRKNPRATWYGNVDHVSADSDLQATVHLKRPQPSILTLLASGYSPVYSCHVTAAQMRTHPIGTGPFKFAEFKPKESIKLVRNPDYWKKSRPYLDGIDFTIVPNRGTAMLSFVSGRFDITFPWEVTMPLLKDIKSQKPDANCMVTSMNNSTNLILNRDAPPFDSSGLRKALSLAIDRKAFIDIINQGEAQQGGTMQPVKDGVWGMPEEMYAAIPGYGPDVAKNREQARELMKKAGYGPDKHLKLKISTRGISLYKDPGEPAQGDLDRRRCRHHRDRAVVPQGRAQGLFDRPQHDRQRRRRSRPELLRELLVQVGAQLHRLLQSRDREAVRYAEPGEGYREAEEDRLGDRQETARGRRAPHHHVEPCGDLHAAFREGLRAAGEQRLQRLQI
jgi:peptide/nickel transport system substrate-binding protein